MDPKVDAAHVPAPLAVDQGESSWICAQVEGGGRQFAVLAWLHRTGPRLTRFDAGPGLLDHDQLPSALRDLVPSWLPIVTPVKVRTDDRPLLMVVLYDLDHPEALPIQVEQEVAPSDFDPATFSASTTSLTLRAETNRLVVAAKTSQLRLNLDFVPTKPAVAFGDNGSPTLRHGDIEVGYLQRPRLRVSGTIAVDGESLDVTGEGAHDRHWRTTSAMNLAWLWLHLRLDGQREVNAYVIRDSRSAESIVGTGGWWIDAAARVRALGDFLLERRGDVYVFEAPTLDVRTDFVHAVERPYLRMKAFGGAIDGGISEAPIRVVAPSTSRAVKGWLEVFDASECKVR